MKPLHIDDEEVRQACEEAAKAACERLDRLFPGGDAGGITSNFQGGLAEVLREMLVGDISLGGRTLELPALVHTDRMFYGPGALVEPAQGYVVRRKSDGKVLNWAGTGFVTLASEDGVDPFTSFAAAVQGAMAFYKREGLTMQDLPLEVISVDPSGEGWSDEAACHARVQQLAAVWREKWPQHCKACHGWGGSSSTQSHPYGMGSAHETLFDPCEATERPETCHRCGSDGLDADGNGPCKHCGWNYDDGDPEHGG